MASVVQLEESNFNNGLPPPLRELLLEIQVHKLIQEYLFSSNADDMCTTPNDESNKNKEMKAPDRLFPALGYVCNTPCVKPTEALDYLPKQSLHEPHHLQTACREEKGSLHVAYTPQEASFSAISVQNENRLMYKTAYLNRVDTFPCTSTVQPQVGTPHSADMEIKVSCKKPPRPPRPPKSELNPSLPRSSSDNGAYSQTSRRAKLERKRKAMAANNVDTSVWALLFTLCFAIIMVAQGFLSQANQQFATSSSDAPSSMETLITASSKLLPAEVSSGGVAERQVSTEGVHVFKVARRALP